MNTVPPDPSVWRDWIWTSLCPFRAITCCVYVFYKDVERLLSNIVKGQSHSLSSAIVWPHLSVTHGPVTNLNICAGMSSYLKKCDAANDGRIITGIVHHLERCCFFLQRLTLGDYHVEKNYIQQQFFFTLHLIYSRWVYQVLSVRLAKQIQSFHSTNWCLCSNSWQHRLLSFHYRHPQFVFNQLYCNRSSGLEGKETS